MPTTQPLDEDQIGDIIGGPFKSIAGFAQTNEKAKAQPSQQRVLHNASYIPKKDTQAVQATNKPESRQLHSTHNGNLRLNNSRIPTLALNQKKQSESQQVQQPKTSASVSSTHRNETYSPSDVGKAWQKFIDDNHAEHILISAMRAAIPVNESGNKFLITQSNVHLNYIKENIDRITAFIRDSLKNDNIVFEFREVSEDSPLIWNERELIQHMVENNPNVARFISDLDLHLL